MNFKTTLILIILLAVIAGYLFFTRDTVEVIPADLLDKLDRPAKSYRETKLIQTPSFDISQLTLARKNETIRLNKTGSDWQIAEPIKAPADAAAITDLVNALTGIKAK